MIRSFSYVAAVSFALGSGAHAADIKLYTEEFPPLNFERDGQIVGLGADQVVEMMDRAGISYDMELTQWSRAISLAEKKPDTCVFSTSHTDARDPNFQWVEPLAVEQVILIKAKDSDVAAADLAAASALRVGTQTGDYTIGILEKNNFASIDLSPAPDVTIKKLLAGRIDLMVASTSFLEAAVSDGQQLEEVLVVAESMMSVACSKSTGGDMVARMQAALQSMIDDGTQAEIQAKYN